MGWEGVGIGKWEWSTKTKGKWNSPTTDLDNVHAKHKIIRKEENLRVKNENIFCLLSFSLRHLFGLISAAKKRNNSQATHIERKRERESVSTIDVSFKFVVEEKKIAATAAAAAATRTDNEKIRKLFSMQFNFICLKILLLLPPPLLCTHEPWKPTTSGNQ